MTIIIRFERNCGTFTRGEGKNPLSSTTLNQLAPKNNLRIKNNNNNDHGMDIIL
jgi:hypothetical protein